MTRKTLAAAQATLVALVLALVVAPDAGAQKSGGPLESRLEARKVVKAADGKETLAGAEEAKPGDVIEYVATYRNAGKAPLLNLEATLPIPSNTVYIAGSARPASAKASTNGATFEPMPLKRRVRTATGVEVERPVPLAEYRALRWYPGELGSEGIATFTARVKVADESTPPPAPAAVKGGGK